MRLVLVWDVRQFQLNTITILENKVVVLPNSYPTEVKVGSSQTP